MLSAIIATHELGTRSGADACRLVPGATAGLLGEVIVADAGSSDATAEVADIAGCRFISFDRAAGRPAEGRRRQHRARRGSCSCAPAACRSRAGSRPPTVSWRRPTCSTAHARTAVFRPPGAADLLHPRLSELAALLRVMLLGGGAKPEQGLLIARRFYDDDRRPSGRRRSRGGDAAQDRPAADCHAAGRRRTARARYLDLVN